MTERSEHDESRGHVDTAGVPLSSSHGRGSAVVALGGGHGLAASLAAARVYAGELTGIVSVGDDGGSSGRLRAELGVAAPGDLRRCLSALAGDETLLARSLEHRFGEGSLAGHPIGNLLLLGLSFAAGNLQEAIDEVGRLVGAVGRVVPATEVPVTLIADSDGGTLAGQVTIERASGIRNLRFDPSDPPVPRLAIEAADQIIIGPGSLFTSVLATAVVPRICEALRAAEAQKVFVANIANDKGEARGFGLAAHVEALADHGVDVDVVLADPSVNPDCPSSIRLVSAAMAAADGWSHEPKLLAAALSELVASC